MFSQEPGTPGTAKARPTGCGGAGLRNLLRSGSDRVDVQRDAGAERGRDGALLNVAALRGGRLETHDLLESGLDVLVELLGGEAGLAHDEVHVGVLVDA